MRNEKSIIDFVGKHNFGGNSARGEAMVTAQESQVTESQEKTTSISIEGLAEHYHTGDEIELVASIE
ncbi:hypothetical protein [Ruoffia tabacinasalis]|uniref:hypothetical protein n=1 Tax=Ruoffia tabacinasalis TaxID=87458 RepID=UPI0030D3426D